MDNPTRRFNDFDNQDEATRRIDPGAENQRRCLRCGAEMSAANVQTSSIGWGSIKPQELEITIWTGKNWIGTPQFVHGMCAALVCLRCGYTELVTNISQLHE